MRPKSLKHLWQNVIQSDKDEMTSPTKWEKKCLFTKFALMLQSHFLMQVTEEQLAAAVRELLNHLYSVLLLFDPNLVFKI